MSRQYQLTGYPSKQMYDQFILKAAMMDLSKSEAVQSAIELWLKQDVYDKAQDLVRPSEDKLDQILNNQRYIMDAVYGGYRNANYVAHLLNGGIPLAEIHGQPVMKPNSSIKSLARMKALKNYAELRGETLSREEFLADYPEDADDEMEPVKISDSKPSNIIPFR